MITARNSASLCILWALFSGIPGCGGDGDRPDLGSVQGNVTLDGKPLSGVIISFNPESGRAASAVTDSEGNYELIYRYGVKGAKVGPTTISFAWPTGVAGSHAIPQKYSQNSILKEDVQPGENEFDFPLESEPESSSENQKVKEAE